MEHGQASAAHDRTFAMCGVNDVIEGAGAAQRLKRHLRSIEGRHVTVLTSPSVRKAGWFDAVIGDLPGRSVSVVADVRPHNDSESLDRVLDNVAKQPPDVIIAIGGGSVMDAAKLAALSVGMGASDSSPLAAFAAGSRAVSTLPDRTPLIVAIPTTLQGAEWNGYAGAVAADGTKIIIGHTGLTPSVIVLDPLLVADTPVDLWMQSGVRSVDHAIEGLHSRRSHVVSDALAVEAIHQITTHLPHSREVGVDAEAVAGCFRGTWMSIMFVHNVPMGLSHAIGHQLGALGGVPHGATSSIVLPHVLRFLAPRASRAQARIREALARSGAEGDSTADALEAWLDTVKVPRTLRDYALSDALLETISTTVASSPLIDVVPGPVSADDVRGILARAW